MQDSDTVLQKKLDESDWVYDPVEASKSAQTHSRPKNAPPHWVRCDFVRDGVRCVKGEGHEKGVGEQAKHEGKNPQSVTKEQVLVAMNSEYLHRLGRP